MGSLKAIPFSYWSKDTGEKINDFMLVKHVEEELKKYPLALRGDKMTL